MPAFPATWMRAAQEKATAAWRLHDLHPASAATLLHEAAVCALCALIVRAGRQPYPNETPRHLWLDLKAYDNVPSWPEMQRRLRFIEDLDPCPLSLRGQRHARRGGELAGGRNLPPRPRLRPRGGTRDHGAPPL